MNNENDIYEASRERNKPTNSYNDRMEITDSKNLDKRIIPIAKMEPTKEIVQCKLCTRTWKPRAVGWTWKQHMETHHMYPIIVQKPGIGKNSADTFTLCENNADEFNFTYSKINGDGKPDTFCDNTNDNDSQCANSESKDTEQSQSDIDSNGNESPTDSS